MDVNQAYVGNIQQSLWASVILNDGHGMALFSSDRSVTSLWAPEYLGTTKTGEYGEGTFFICDPSATPLVVRPDGPVGSH